jgi:hypothetical protein
MLGPRITVGELVYAPFSVLCALYRFLQNDGMSTSA